MTKKHMIIPDVQVRPGVNTDHLEWIGRYAAEKRPDVIVQIGDFADLPSLSSYSVGKAEAEGKRYKRDVAAVHAAMERLITPIIRVKGYKPRMVLTLGNHEDRISREVEANARLEGVISIDDLKYEEYGWEVHPFLKIVKIDGIEYCLEENHKVLTEDLYWRALKDIKIGDRLVGFDENREGRTATGKELARRYATAIVEKHDIDVAPLYTVLLADGTALRATAEHRWLARTPLGLDWVTTLNLNGLALPRLMQTWRTDESREAGWLAGLFDGEGCLSKPNTNQGGIQLTVAQNPGHVLDRITQNLSNLGFVYDQHVSSRECVQTRIAGPSGTKLRLLGEIRPERLIKKFNSSMLGRLQAMNGDVPIVSITPQGNGRIVKIKTSTGTMIVEGFPQHNCHYFTSGVMGRPVSSAASILRERHCSGVMGHVQHTDVAFHKKSGHVGIQCGICYTHDEKYLTPQGNTTRRQIVMLHEVHNGTADPMFVSLSFLRNKYAKG